MELTQANLLADTYEMAYGLVRFYTGNLKKAEPYKQWEVNGAKLNSIAWINSHLCWSENFLLLQAAGSPSCEIAWLEHYSFGSDGTLHDPKVDMKVILNDRKIVHEAAMNHIRGLTNEELEKENPMGIQFGPSKSIKSIIQHAIRHEGTHAGHLGWLCKINGMKTV
ncbi:MAG: DinB family protein [Bacteroidota bacterium]